MTARRVDDFYETPAWCCDRLLEAVSLPTGGTWLEPCAGSGNIIRATQPYHEHHHLAVTWAAVELQERNREALAATGAGAFIADFLKLDLAGAAPVQCVITNPPYSLAQAFIEKCLPLADVVVMLLRVDYLASEARAAFMRAHPPDVYVLPNRPSFTGSGGDMTEYAWFLWGKPPWYRGGQVRVLNTTPLAERRPKGA